MAVYAAYATNLDSARMLDRCRHSPSRGVGWLENWRLTFAGGDTRNSGEASTGGAVATIVEAAGSRVFVMLYDVPRVDEDVLDQWEGLDLGLFNKIRVRVETLDGSVLTWLYAVNAYEGGLPTARYLGQIADAAERAGAPADYVTELRTRPCSANPL